MAHHFSARAYHESLLFPQAVIGQALLTPQMDARRPVSVSSTNGLLLDAKLIVWLEYVNNVPEAFSRAYFEFNALNIYE